jgi:hypothetical protein
LDSQATRPMPHQPPTALRRAQAWEQVQWVLYLRCLANAEEQYRAYQHAAAARDRAVRQWEQSRNGTSATGVGQVTQLAT